MPRSGEGNTHGAPRLRDRSSGSSTGDSTTSATPTLPAVAIVPGSALVTTSDATLAASDTTGAAVANALLAVFTAPSTSTPDCCSVDATLLMPCFTSCARTAARGRGR